MDCRVDRADFSISAFRCSNAEYDEGRMSTATWSDDDDHFLVDSSNAELNRTCQVRNSGRNDRKDPRPLFKAPSVVKSVGLRPLELSLLNQHRRTSLFSNRTRVTRPSTRLMYENGRRMEACLQGTVHFRGPIAHARHHLPDHYGPLAECRYSRSHLAIRQ